MFEVYTFPGKEQKHYFVKKKNILEVSRIGEFISFDVSRRVYSRLSSTTEYYKAVSPI